MFLGRSLQGSVSLLNDSSDSTARSFDSLPMSTSQPNPPPPTTTSTTPHASNVPRTGAAVEKKRNHICQTCSKAFTTSGHLARHIRVHTGERNHKCPFPGCETRCSRQDNLQQQYVLLFLIFPLTRGGAPHSRDCRALFAALFPSSTQHHFN